MNFEIHAGLIFQDGDGSCMYCLTVDVLCRQGKIHQWIYGVSSQYAQKFEWGFSSLTEWKKFTGGWKCEIENEDRHYT